jgi:hypothetical protein
MTSTAPGEGRVGEGNRSLGHTSLSEDEREVLTWSREGRLEGFHKINYGIDAQALENKLFYIDTLTVDSGEILDILKLNPRLCCSPLETPTRSNPIIPEAAYIDEHDSVHLVAQPCVLRQVGSRP